jgi:dTDP-glucose 4,6-dehydratase
MKTCLVTGGAGFIGSWLSKDLLKKGYRVICVDDLSTGKIENLMEIKTHKNFSFKKLDINKKIKILEKIDYIFHLASPAIPFDYLKDPVKTAITNSVGTINVLNLAKEKHAKFLLASSSDIYGDPQIHPQREEHMGHVDHISRKSCYYEGKRFSETMTQIFHKIHNVDTNVVRIFNTYGPNMRKDGTAISIFIRQCIKNDTVTINGTGEQKRSFCYTQDIVNGMEYAMFSNYTGEIFNLGSSDEITINELLEHVKRITKSSSKIIYKKMPEEDPMRVIPDLTKAQKMLKWRPAVSLDSGIEETVKWFKEN